MARYAQGGPVTLSTEVRDAAGNLTTPGDILLRVRKPDGTFLPDYTSPTADDTGKYHQDLSALDLAALGHYQYAWITTGTAAGVVGGVFDVIDPFEPALLSLQDAKAHLGETGTQQDEEIRAFAQVATEVVESIVGPCTPRTIVESVYAHYGRLALTTRPVISVTSATLGGSPVSTATWTVPSPLAGLVELGAGAWWGGGGPGFPGQLYTVTYLAGRTVVPGRLEHAAKEMLRHLWATQRGQTVDGPLPDFSGDGEFAESAALGSSFSIPNRVKELLSSDQLPSIA